MFGNCSTTRSIMPKNALGSSFDFAATSGPCDAEALLQVLLVADEHVDVLDDAAEHRDRAIGAARGASTASRGSSGRTTRPRRPPSPPASPR